MRVLITGGSGQLGRALRRLARPGTDIFAFDSASLDVSDFDDVRAIVERYEPELVIHAGAMTDVDGCERDAALAYQINALGSQNIAACASQASASLVYVSTNFVFDGEAAEPYHEFVATNPISVYGASKLAGERAVRALCPRHYIVRTAMVYDETGRNFVNTMLRLAEERPSLNVVADQVGNPTYAADLAGAIWRLIEKPAYGTYHLTNEGTASWFDWAVATLQATGSSTPVEPVPASAYQRLARPPRNGALANVAAARLGIRLPVWQDGLRRCLARRTELLSEA